LLSISSPSLSNSNKWLYIYKYCLLVGINIYKWSYWYKGRL
jgi:hypothetical protein